MKNKLYISGLILSGSLILLSTGCEKFLVEDKNPSSFTEDGYYTKPEHAESAVTAVYADLRSIGAGVGTFGGDNMMFLEFPTGLTNTDVNQHADNVTLRTLAYTPENAYVNNWWNFCFRGIANANLALSKIPSVPDLSDVTKNQYLGEVRFLRAFYYFYLVRIYGDIPLMTKPANAASAELYSPRSPVESIYKLIVEDLVFAESAGLSWKNEGGRTSLGAVKSLLAEVYLTMAGSPLNKGLSHYTLAANKAKEVIDNGSFSLFANYDDLHNPALENKTEHIFMVQYTASIANNEIQIRLLPSGKNISAYDDENGALYATNQFIKTYESGDKRVAEQQFYYTQYPSAANRSNIVDLGSYYIFKHFDKSAHGTATVSGAGVSSLNWPLIRYAQVLLTYAEAQNETAQNPAAYNALNAIRSRAALPALSGLSQDQFRQAVWRERWHELAYENQTWFDMVRLKKAYNLTSGNFENFVGHQFTYGSFTLQSKNLLFPIPLNEMRNNPNIKTQNPGY